MFKNTGLENVQAQFVEQAVSLLNLPFFCLK